jgi:amino acid adenylation domain-containing protein/thioester reductase-like protein
MIQKTETLAFTKHQNAIWIESKIHPDTAIFNIGTCIKIEGEIDSNVLSEAISKVILENDGLRLQVKNNKASAEQYFEKERAFSLQQISFEKEEEAVNWMKSDFVTATNINDKELFQIVLVQFSEEDYYLYFKYHHICIDGWSRALFVRKIADQYNALCNGIEHSDSSSYEKYINQQNTLEDDNSEALEFWKQKFTDFERVSLFTKKDIQKSNTPSDRIRLKFDREKYETLSVQHLNPSKGRFYFLLAAYYLTLSRALGKKEIVIGIPLLNRFNETDLNTIGYYVGLLPLRLSFDANKSFDELVQYVRNEMRMTAPHREVSIFEINKEIGINFSNFTQLYDAVFSFEEHNHDVQFGEATVNHSGTFSSDFEQNPLVLHVQNFNANDAVNFEFDFNLNYLNADETQLIIQRYENIINHFSNNTNANLSEAPVLFDDELAQLKQFAQGPTRDISKENLLKRIYTNFDRNGSKIAVRDENKALTFDEVMHTAEQIAAQLHQNATKKGDVVAIVLPRSADLIPSILGTLMTGAGYLVIDPALPEDRIDFMLKEVRANAIVCNGEFGQWPLFANFQKITIDSLEDAAFQRRPIETDALAFIMFTSGTTGRPKAVPINHLNTINLIDALMDGVYSKFDANSKLAVISSFNFDAAIQHTFMCLARGFEINIVPEAARKDGKLLVDYLVDNEIDLSDGIPTHLSSMILRVPKAPEGFKVKHFIIGGEAYKPELARQFFEWLGDKEVELTNAYGPAETTVESTQYTFNRHNYTQYDDISLGKGIQNTRLWVLDENQQLVPPGVIGEICIGGAGLSKGYMHRDEITTEKFKENKYINERIYHTGDLGRWNSDGFLFFNGRKDNQVKLRGYRIELSEIEHWLSAIPGVDLAVVMIQKRAQKDVLIGYIQSDSPIDQKTVKTYLAQKLPDFMLPNHIHRSNKFPVTMSGKIDRTALMNLTEVDVAEVINEPESKIEKELAKIMGEVLEIDAVDAEESFFSQGGDSLGLVFFLAQVEEEMGVLLSMNQFATMSSIREIANYIQSNEELDRQPVDLNEETRIAEELLAYSNNTETQKNNVALLTGATGFVGAFLLMELAKSYEKVICLVRDASQENAEKRLAAALNGYNIDLQDHSAEIEVLVSDLSQSNLGLSVADFEELQQSVDAVYHCGAEVNFIKDFETMKKTNIGSTMELLKLCKLNRAKKFNYISTIGVFSDVESTFSEDAAITSQIHYKHRGYETTKWIAEGIIDKARLQGVNASIFRLGRITGHSANGTRRQDDFFHRFLDGCTELSSFPEELLNETTDLTAVDLTVKSIVELAQNTTGENYHIVNHKRASYKTMLKIFEEAGKSIALVPYDEWLKSVEAICKIDHKNPLFLILPILKQKSWFSVHKNRLNSSRTIQQLKHKGIQWPEGNELWNVYIKESVNQSR